MTINLHDHIALVQLRLGRLRVRVHLGHQHATQLRRKSKLPTCPAPQIHNLHTVEKITGLFSRLQHGFFGRAHQHLLRLCANHHVQSLFLPVPDDLHRRLRFRGNLRDDQSQVTRV